MNDMKRLLSYAGPYKRDMIFGAVLVLVETCFELFIPILISNLIDIGLTFTARESRWESARSVRL